MTLAGTIPTPAPTAPGATWTRNAAAQIIGSDLQLGTPAVTQTAGSAFYPDPVATAGLQIDFTSYMGGGTGGGGLCLVLADPAQAGPGSLGAPGDGLGFTGIPGVALVLCTDQNTPPGANNYIGIATSTAAAAGAPTYLATSTTVPALRPGTHDFTVTLSGGTMTVTCDGVQYLSHAVTLGPVALVGFTGSNGTYRGATNPDGSFGDTHAVRSVAIAATTGSTYSRQIPIQANGAASTEVAPVGVWTPTYIADAAYYGWVNQSDGTQGDTITFDAACDAGTYTLELFHLRFQSRGIYTVKIDGTTVGTIDGFAASLTPTRSALTGIAIGAGQHTVTLAMLTQNGSATGFIGQVERIVLTRTA